MDGNGSDWDAWEALRRDAGVSSTLKRARPKRAPRPAAAPPPMPLPIQGPRLPHPWETPEFDPGADANLARADMGRRLSGLRLGASLHEVGGVRWVIIQNAVIWWTGRRLLAYPLPSEWGDGEGALDRFEAAWRAEAQRLAGR